MPGGDRRGARVTRRLRGERRAGGLAVVLAALLLLPAPAAAASWQELLEGAGEAARTRSYAGEALLLSSDGDRSRSARVTVGHTPERGLLVDVDGARLHVGEHGGGVVAGGHLLAPLPGLDLAAGDDLQRLERKYEVALRPREHVMDRPCIVVEVTRRRDGALRERLWIDEASGLVVRRETYDRGTEPVRLAAYLSLDLDPRRVRSAVSRSLREDQPAAVPGTRAAAPLDARELAALEEAGWLVPGPLPEAYDPLGAYAVDAGTSQPLQLVFGDGLYVVSVFQQRGRPDWSSLPSGAAPVAGLPYPAWEWPGAIPPRLLWEADGRTWTLVGDAPASDLQAIAAALPHPSRPSPLERLRRGLSRLWSIVTPWGED
jgi:hypothetical protein